MASLGISSPDSWPRMPSGVENPFQNAPGPFIYALPNLAAPGPSLFSLNCPGLAPLSNHHDDHRHHHHPRHNPAATPYNSPVEPACPLPENADSESSHVLQFPPITFEFDENDEEDDAGPSQQQQQEQSSSGSSTPTPSQGSSSTAASESESPEEKEEEGSENSPKERGKRRRRTGKGARRRRRNRHSSEQAGCVMGPRVMGMPGFHPQRWFQQLPTQLSPSLPLPGPMPGVLSHAPHAHAWYPVAGYSGYAVSGSSPTWLLAATPVPGLFGLSAS